jgi:glucokinase
MFLLVGDIGGTNSRLALYEQQQGAVDEASLGRVPSVHAKNYLNEKFAAFEDIVKAFLEEFGAVGKVIACCMAVAGPIENNRVVMTNRDFVIDGSIISEAMGIPRVELINDFLANGYGCLCLNPEDKTTIQEGIPVEGATIALVGAGTGLGVGYLTQSPKGEYQAYPSEGGHCDFGPRDALEFELLQFLMTNYNRHRISYERVVSGRGIYEVYEFFAKREPKKVSKEVTRELAAAADQQAGVVAKYQEKCELCKKTMDLFISVYGSAAGNIALTNLPRGGLYVCGGIAMKNLGRMRDGTFLEAFNDKGRISPLVVKMPVHIVLADDLGRRGALLVACRLARKPLASLRASRALSREEKKHVHEMMDAENAENEDFTEQAKPLLSPSSPRRQKAYPDSAPPSAALVFRTATGASLFAPLVPMVPASPMIVTRSIAATPRDLGTLTPFAYPPATARSYLTLPATARSYSTLRTARSFV